MTALNVLAYLVAFIISAGEIARFWGSGRLIPMALDEVLISAALMWAAWRSRRDGAYWHVAAWGAFCGLTLFLLVETMDHQINGPAKENGAVYLTALSVMSVLGLWSLGAAISLVRRAAER